MRNDLDPVETSEWREAFDSVIEFDGADRAEFLLEELNGEARRNGVPVPYSANTPYLNTLPPHAQLPHPGDRAIEHRIRSLIRWNAVAIVLRANKESSELGGHKANFPWAASGRSLSLGRDEGMTKVIFDETTDRIIGCGIVGPNAGDLIAEAGQAIELGADAADIGLTIHPHPTLSETVAMAAEAFEGTITDLYLPKKAPR